MGQPEIRIRLTVQELPYREGKAERDRVFADVRYGAEDDTREVLLQPAELRRLLEACEGRGGAAGRSELRTIVRVRQVSIWARGEAGAETYAGEVYLRDRKADKRPRTVPVTDGLCRELLALIAGKGPDEPVFETAQRVAWRIVKDWVEAQLAIVEADVAGMAEVFMPYAVHPDGRTLFQHFEASPQRLLNA